MLEEWRFGEWQATRGKYENLLDPKDTKTFLVENPKDTKTFRVQRYENFVGSKRYENLFG